MKKILLLLVIVATITATSCKKEASNPNEQIPSNSPRTEVPATVQGNWMMGSFSMTEYWDQNPADYLGNAFEIAIAFSFNDNGTYTQYFSSSYVILGQTTYQQAISKGTLEVDPVNKIIKTHPTSSHYKRTKNGQTEEEGDTPQSELNHSIYSYETGVENGAKALYLQLKDTENPLVFLHKP